MIGNICGRGGVEMRQITQLRQKLLISGAAVCTAAVMWLAQIPCVFRVTLGISCPGCGMTRAFLAALRLDFAAAFAHHWMFWAVPLGWLYILFDGRLFGRKWLDRTVLCVIGAGFLVNWLFNPSI